MQAWLENISPLTLNSLEAGHWGRGNIFKGFGNMPMRFMPIEKTLRADPKHK